MKTVVVTGASRGIGFATAQKFLKEGWKVIGADLESITINHPQFVPFQYNQGNLDSVANLAQQIADVMPALDVLINNAGILLDAKESSADPIAVEKTFEVNVVGVIGFTEKLIPLLHEGSHVVNIASRHGSFSEPIDDPGSVGYRISKAGLNMYTRHLAFRLRPQGIIVSSIAPGWVKTDMGYSIATEKEQPDREPAEAAEDIFQLATTVTETGQFWHRGNKIEW